MILNAYTYGDFTHQSGLLTTYFVIEAIDTGGLRYAGTDSFTIAVWSDGPIPGTGVTFSTPLTISGDHNAPGTSYTGTDQGLALAGIGPGAPGSIVVRAAMTYFDTSTSGLSAAFTWNPPGGTPLHYYPEPPPILDGFLTPFSPPYVYVDLSWSASLSKDSRYDKIFYQLQWNYDGTWRDISLSGSGHTDHFTPLREVHLGPYSLVSPIGFRVTAHEPWLGGPSFPSNEVWTNTMGYGPGPVTSKASWGFIAR